MIPQGFRKRAMRPGTVLMSDNRLRGAYFAVIGRWASNVRLLNMLTGEEESRAYREVTRRMHVITYMEEET